MAGSLKNRYQDVLELAHTFLKSGNRQVSNLPSKERKGHAEREGAQCPICGARITARASNEDHILPRNLGGTNDKHNRVLMCFGCNTFRDQVQRIAFGAQGPSAAREIYKVDPERIDSFILWLQVTVDEGIVAGAAYEETQSTNSIFAEMGGSNQPNIPIENRLGRYSEWEPKIGSQSEMLETKSTEHAKSMIDPLSRDGGDVEKAEILSSSQFEFEREIRQGIIQILRDYRGTGEPMISNAFGEEFNRMTRENNFPPRKAINESLGLRRSATIRELLDRLFGDEISYIGSGPSFLIVRRQNWKNRIRTWWRRVTELLGRIWRPSQPHVDEPVDGNQLEIPTSEPEEEDSEPVLNDIIGTEHDPIEKFLRSLSGQTVEISYLGRLLSDAFPKTLGTPRQWLKEHGHGERKPFGRILAESYSHLIDEEIHHGSTILYVIGDAESIEEISDESGNMPIPHFNSARGFLMPRNPDDVASILIAFEACRGEEFVYGEAIDLLLPNLEQPVDRIVGVIVRLRELLGITIDDEIDWNSTPTPEKLLIQLRDQFIENWIPLRATPTWSIPEEAVTEYFSQSMEHLESKSWVSVKPPSSALDWLNTNTLEIMNSADSEWVNQAWFTNALNSRAENSPYGSRQKLFESLDFKAKESVRTVLENIMGELIQFEQVEPTYWRARLA